METEPLVDIGLTAYRRATYIAEAVESVLAQTLKRWHLTVSDNGLGESDVERAMEPYLSDGRIAYQSTGRELSLAANWTNALNSGSARYVAVLNDDDRWHPGFLQARVEALERHPECGFAFSECVVVDENGVETFTAPLRFSEGVMRQERLAELFMEQNPVVPPAILLRRSACDVVGSYFDERWQYCDWELWARLAARFPAYYLARQDNDFRRHHPGAYTYSTREPPDQLLEMLKHLEGLYAREVPGFHLSRMTRARTRSLVLLRAAADVHGSGGWRASSETYRRALREYPPIVFSRTSLRIVGRTVLGERGARRVGSMLRRLRLSR